MEQAVRTAHEHHRFQILPTRLELPASYPYRPFRNVGGDTHDRGRLIHLCRGVASGNLKNEEQSECDSNTLSPHLCLLAGPQWRPADSQWRRPTVRSLNTTAFLPH